MKSYLISLSKTCTPTIPDEMVVSSCESGEGIYLPLDIIVSQFLYSLKNEEFIIQRKIFRDFLVKNYGEANVIQIEREVTN